MIYTPRRPSCLWGHQNPGPRSFCPLGAGVLHRQKQRPNGFATTRAPPLQDKGDRDWHFKRAGAKNTIISHTFFWKVGVWLGETQHVKYDTVQLKTIGKL